METVKRMATILQLQKDQNETAFKWSGTLTKWYGQLSEWYDSTGNANADEVAEMRNDLDDLTERSAEIDLVDETNELVSELEAVLTSIHGKAYRHRNRRTLKLKEDAPSIFTSRVSFAPVDVFKSVEGANYDLVPREILHPLYEAWWPSTISESIRMMKAVPIDIKGLGKVATQKLRARNTRGTFSMKMSDVPCFRSGLLGFSLKRSEKYFRKMIEPEDLEAVIAKSIEH